MGRLFSMQPEIRGELKSDFFNRIGPSRTSLNMNATSALQGKADMPRRRSNFRV
jgi:hypothetical protein